MSDSKKKVTKIIRKDGISYRTAGGSQVSSTDDVKTNPAPKDNQG